MYVNNNNNIVQDVQKDEKLLAERRYGRVVRVCSESDVSDVAEEGDESLARGRDGTQSSRLDAIQMLAMLVDLIVRSR